MPNVSSECQPFLVLRPSCQGTRLAAILRDGRIAPADFATINAGRKYVQGVVLGHRSREADGRFIANVPDLKNLSAYGTNEKDVVASLTELATEHIRSLLDSGPVDSALTVGG